jgi:hypothetical protein
LPTMLPNPNARIALLKLDSGHWLLAYNPTQSSRSPLRLALSEDGGASWPYSLDVESAIGEEFSYPYLIQTDDGYIHLGYTHRRLSMRHLVFTEAFMRTNTSIPSNTSYTTKAEYSGGVLRNVDVCGYSIVDVDPPEFLSLTASPNTLQGPNHAMVAVTVTPTVADEVDPSPSSRIVAVSSSEAQAGLWKNDIGPDWEITGPLTLNLRAERVGSGPGRVYTITVESRDRSGNASTKSVNVVVPHDMKS